MAAKPKNFRVICPEYTVYAGTEAGARAMREAIVKLGACQHDHTMEVRVGIGEWVPAHVERARMICAASMGSLVETPDGPLCVARRWMLHPGRDGVETAEFVILTADGGDAELAVWCTCEVGKDLAGWVRHERWQLRGGRTGHGYVCPGCRQMTQSG